MVVFARELCFYDQLGNHYLSRYMYKWNLLTSVIIAIS